MWDLVDANAINRNPLKTHQILFRGASVHKWALICAFSTFARSFYASRPLFPPGALVCPALVHENRVTCRLSKAGQMTSPDVRASRSRLVRDVTGELAKSKDMHACVLTHAT